MNVASNLISTTYIPNNDYRFSLLQHKKSAIKYASTYCATPNFKMD